MKNIEQIFKYRELAISDLDSEYLSLINYAREMRDLAYAPYSNFKVGTALLLENGKMIGGNNQENVAYPSGMCAERVALFACNSQFPFVKIKAMLIVSSCEDKIISPCGACRQVMHEVVKRQSDDFDVIMASDSKILVVRAKDLLPLAFDFLK